MHTLNESTNRQCIFYQKNSLSVCLGMRTSYIFQSSAGALAEITVFLTRSSILQKDEAGTVIGASGPKSSNLYTAYGHRRSLTDTTILGFSGQRFDSVSNAYPLGAGHRFYSPSLMRFLTPDSLSPFATGGLNSYVYCQSDPINRQDPNGQWWVLHRALRVVGRATIAVSKAIATTVSSGLRSIGVTPRRARAYLQENLQTPITNTFIATTRELENQLGRVPTPVRQITAVAATLTLSLGTSASLVASLHYRTPTAISGPELLGELVNRFIVGSQTIRDEVPRPVEVGVRPR